MRGDGASREELLSLSSDHSCQCLNNKTKIVSNEKLMHEIVGPGAVVTTRSDQNNNMFDQQP